MKKWLIVLAMLALPLAAQAEDFTEVDVSAFETIDNEFKPQARISLLNYVDDKGIGLYVGQGETAGPLLSWRVWKHDWSFGMSNAIHVIGSTDLVQSDLLDNGRSGIDIRWSWSGAGNIGVSTKIVWTFVDGESSDFTPSIGIVIQPGAGK